ncbi:MAG TPA: type II toxin-antitoxin system VapB family antitoxin [Geminicoccaceae bacterium]|nr:type II toxin-antitoxin system VapB family antitoxin [Geminicoccus sp.]HMU51781.1 type II toxin-antitoxin system VapB family antitoxin [Geminicoccaceae bacterium]
MKDRETDSLVRELAALTGEPITDAVKVAVRERLERERRVRPRKASIEEIMELVEEFAAKPVIDPRTPDEIIGYDEHGLPA